MRGKMCYSFEAQAPNWHLLTSTLFYRQKEPWDQPMFRGWRQDSMLRGTVSSQLTKAWYLGGGELGPFLPSISQGQGEMSRPRLSLSHFWIWTRNGWKPLELLAAFFLSREKPVWGWGQHTREDRTKRIAEEMCPSSHDPVDIWINPPPPRL